MMKTSFSNELQQLQMELRAQNFDIIRFSTYRTACKLRFIQKKLNFHHLDLLNVIESLRESLTSLLSEHRTQSSTLFLSVNHLTTFLTSIYTNLNKRLPFSQQILHIDHCVHSAIAWFLYVYNTQNNSIRFNSFRVVLILLCTGKLIDKMRHLFTSCLTSSSTHTLTYGQIDELLHEMLALPYALQEISQSTFEKNYAQTIFAHLSSPISLTQFLDILIYNNSAPNCLQWLIIFHRLISVENVIHRVKCSACQRPSFSGFRYKCLQCHHRTYQLCQDCFWRGRTSHHHLSTHEMKEYTYFISPNKDFRQSIRKSFQCVPKNDKRNQLLSPLTIDKEQRVIERHDDVPNTQINSDEHKQIASYTNQLAYLTDKQHFKPTVDRSRRAAYNHQRAEKKLTISKLEGENRRIQHEINTLRSQIKHQSLEQIDHQPYYRREFSSHRFNDFHPIRRAGSMETTNKNSYFAHELQALSTRKIQLEYRIRQLQQSREELTSQLDYLERSFSPHVRSKNTQFRSYSTPTTPVHHRMTNHLRTDLLLAADSLTSAMSSLVHQLNTEENNSIRRNNHYSYKYGNRIDDEPYVTSDDDDNDRAFYFSPIDRRNRENRPFT